MGVTMERFALRCSTEPTACHCPVCGEQSVLRPGPRVFLEGGEGPLCRKCALKLAPSLGALIDLAQVAENVGRKSRHLLTPPMESLLALARAAENYTNAAPRLAAAV
jgi:hypothetical protein